MLVAETEYKHQVETDIRPFHDVLLGLFFITIGMKLTGGRCWTSGPGAAADLAPVLAKFRWWRRWRGCSAPAPGWRCAPACTWRRPASSASCC
jgi:hypothetical protein